MVWRRVASSTASLRRIRTMTIIPGLLDVLAQYQVAQIVDAGYPKERTTPYWKAFTIRAVPPGGAQRARRRRPSTLFELRSIADRQLRCGDLQARIIHADSADLKDMGSGNTRENNASTVIQLKFGAFTFLFMGDAEGKERGDAADHAQFVERLLLDRAKSEPDLAARRRAEGRASWQRDRLYA